MIVKIKQEITGSISITWILRYCKRGYFRWGKISRKRWKDISRWGNFHDITHISFIQAYGFYFRVGVIFAKKTKARKTRKLPPRENFHVYSIQTCNLSHMLPCWDVGTEWYLHQLYTSHKENLSHCHCEDRESWVLGKNGLILIRLKRDLGLPYSSIFLSLPIDSVVDF